MGKKCPLHIVNQIRRNCPFTRGLAEARGLGRNAHFTLLISASAGSVFQKLCLVLFPWQKNESLLLSIFSSAVFLNICSFFKIFSECFLMNNTYQYFWQARFLKEGLDWPETLLYVHIFNHFWPKYPRYTRGLPGMAHFSIFGTHFTLPRIKSQIPQISWVS